MESTPMIFCVVPHGVAPFGITAYPLWSKLWNDRTCHWTCAPILLKLPIVGYFLKKIGYIPAKSHYILDTLTKKEENVGIILDGIAGMFQTPARDFHTKTEEEVAYLKHRKGIVKIALRAGVPIVPVYGFGHTALYTVVVDPFGILQWLSLKLNVSLVPFFGRFFWFLGPPKRRTVSVCLGEPIHCPKIEDPTPEQIRDYHQRMLDSFQQVFDRHKAAYGWEHKKLKFV
jgi:1-acyl-sn-glycerol-3-phosphate acyltransferase